MIKYELVFILDARLSDAEKTGQSQQISALVEKNGGKVLNVAVWLEKHRFSFPMKKVWEGTYYLMNFEMKGTDTARFRRELQLNERVLRFLTVKCDVKKTA